MRTIYAAVLTFLLICIFLFMGSLFYMDREKHRVYFYEINKDGCTVGTVRVDRFVTEERVLYKSSSELPLDIDASETKERIAFDPGGIFESYSRERAFPKEAEYTYLEKSKDGVSYVSQSGGGLSSASNLPVSQHPFIFNETSPATYLPIAERYDLKEGGPQVFEAFTVLNPDLPPLKRLVALTSAGEEHVKTGGRKIRTEKLVLKIRNYPQGTIWIAKSDKAVIKIELPGDGLRITRVFSFRQPRASQYQYAKNGYRTEKVSFKSKGAELEGTLSVPNGSGRHPAVILVWGSGAQDRSYMGLFDSMSDYLAGKGLCVLRFDKRGIGGSSGSYLYYSTEEETLDIKAAAEYLASRDTTDPSRITVAAHTTGADPAIRACLASDRIRLLVLLCPEIYLGQEDLLENLKRSPAAAINSRYQALIEQSFSETAAMAASAKGNWAYILGKRCYLGEMKWRLSKSAPLNDSIRNIDIPVLIIQGRKDESSYPRHASLIDNALQDTGNDARVLVYYGYLGRFLGKEVSDCTHRAFYDADKDMMDGITRWINESQPKAAQK